MCSVLGLILSFSFSTLYGWAPINFNDLQDEKSMLPMGPLNEYQATIVISILNVGAIIGNFVIVPILLYLGPKKTIHLLSIPIIVS